MSQKPRKPKVKDRVVSEARLLDAAEDVFSKHGFAGATTREIAKKAGINLALIARYFDGKYGLLIAVLQRKMNMFDQMIECKVHDSIVAEWESYVRARWEHMVTDLDFLKIVIGGFLTDDKFLKRFQEIMPAAGKHPELYERVEYYKSIGKVRADADAADLVENMEKAIISTLLFDVILTRKPKEQALEELIRFTKIYVGCFAK